MEYQRCQECDCKLWSNHAKVCGLCPECENVDYSDNAELENKLDNLLNGEIMSKLQSIINEINGNLTSGKYLIWWEICQYTGRIKVSLCWQTAGQTGHLVIKTAYHANALIKLAREILQDKSC